MSEKMACWASFPLIQQKIMSSPVAIRFFLDIFLSQTWHDMPACFSENHQMSNYITFIDDERAVLSRGLFIETLVFMHVLAFIASSTMQIMLLWGSSHYFLKFESTLMHIRIWEFLWVLRRWVLACHTMKELWKWCQRILRDRLR